MKEILKRTYSDKRILLSMLAIFFVSVFSSVAICRQTTMRLEQFHFYNEVQNIYETSEKIDDNSFYVVDGLCNVHLKNHGEFESCDCMVKTEKLMLQKANTGLFSNEASVSKNLADKNKIKVGDYIYISASVFSKSKALIVKEISDSCYGLDNVNYLNASGLLVIGYDEQLAQPSPKYLSFIKDSEKGKVNLPINTKVYPIESAKHGILGFVVGLPILYFSGFLILTLFLFFLLFTDFQNVEKNRKKYGENKKTIGEDTLTITSPVFSLAIFALLVDVVWIPISGGTHYLAIVLCLGLLSVLGILLSQLIYMAKVRRI